MTAPYEGREGERSLMQVHVHAQSRTLAFFPSFMMEYYLTYDGSYVVVFLLSYVLSRHHFSAISIHWSDRSIDRGAGAQTHIDLSVC